MIKIVIKIYDSYHNEISVYRSIIKSLVLYKEVIGIINESLTKITTVKGSN